MKHVNVGIIGAMALAVAVINPSNSSFAVPFTDTFTGPPSAGWVTDRYEPAGFNSVGGRLQITISSADSQANRPPAYNSTFYNTQGRQHQALVNGNWQLTGQLFVTSDQISGGQRSDLWGSTGNVGTEVGADYFILGYIGSTPRVWDSDIGWVNLGGSAVAGQYDIDISYNGSSVDYVLNGNSVYSDTTLGPLTSQFRTVFAQAYNKGESFVQEFDNINVGLKSSSVPDNGSNLASLGLASLGLVVFRKKIQAVTA
jgi:hypothetical protein